MEVSELMDVRANPPRWPVACPGVSSRKNVSVLPVTQHCCSHLPWSKPRTGLEE